jgi:hypothetical protein
MGIYPRLETTTWADEGVLGVHPTIRYTYIRFYITLCYILNILIGILFPPRHPTREEPMDQPLRTIRHWGSTVLDLSIQELAEKTALALQ